jgi:CheY-like chemotaxis protein
MVQGAPQPDLTHILCQKVVGQNAAMQCIVPYIEMYQAQLSPGGRPAGVFLLLGPTGTGKTRTVEAVAEALHGSRSLLKIDCGEFQQEHEIAKLIGAPPGYIGHRETTAILTQANVDAVASNNSDLSVVLFDEIEKAAPSFARLMLGVLDKGLIRLGDNTTSNFERTLIFFTSNIGAPEMMKEMQQGIGFRGQPGDPDGLAKRIEHVGVAAVRKRFSPEFVNRLDAVITYSPLQTESLRMILNQLIAELQDHVNTRLADRCFTVQVSEESCQLLLDKGTSTEYGARELRRTVHRFLTQPLAAMVAKNQLSPGSQVNVTPATDAERLSFECVAGAPRLAKEKQKYAVGLVDDNELLLGILSEAVTDAGYTVWTAETFSEARRKFKENPPLIMAIDYMLPDGNGLDLALALARESPYICIILMTGGTLTAEEATWCVEERLPLLRKPFLPSDLLALIRQRLASAGTLNAADAVAAGS